MTRIVELANRDYFHGDLTAMYLEDKEFTFHESGTSVDCTIVSILIESNKLEKFNSATKLVHELAAHVQEEFKKYCYRHQLTMAHVFKISRLDMSKPVLELHFPQDQPN